MILENKVKAIVMLTELEEKSQHGNSDYTVNQSFLRLTYVHTYVEFQSFFRSNSDAIRNVNLISEIYKISDTQPFLACCIPNLHIFAAFFYPLNRIPNSVYHRTDMGKNL
jgi:hypothetical protein